MMTCIKLAIRNLFRNGRRSLFTIVAIGLGFLAVNALGGFTAYIFTSLQDSYIYAEANGHLTIFKDGFLSKGKLDPTRYLKKLMRSGRSWRGIPRSSSPRPSCRFPVC